MPTPALPHKVLPCGRGKGWFCVISVQAFSLPPGGSERGKRVQRISMPSLNLRLPRIFLTKRSTSAASRALFSGAKCKVNAMLFLPVKTFRSSRLRLQAYADKLVSRFRIILLRISPSATWGNPPSFPPALRGEIPLRFPLRTQAYADKKTCDITTTRLRRRGPAKHTKGGFACR